MKPEVQFYRAIQNDIKEQIRSGQLAPGDKLPSEAELMERYGASKMTVRKSISELEKEGLLYSIERVGSYVSTPDTDQYILHFEETKKIRGIDQIRVIATNVLSIKDSPEFSLGSGTSARIMKIKRIFYSEDMPIAVDTTMIVYTKEMQINAFEMTHCGFASLMSEKLKQFTANHALTLEAVWCPEDISRILNIDQQTVLARIKQYYYDKDNELAGLGETYCLPAYIELEAESI